MIKRYTMFGTEGYFDWDYEDDDSGSWCLYDDIKDSLIEWHGIKPKIVCLCGSTRFMEQLFEAGWEFTLKGYIVLSVGVCTHAEHHGAEALGQDVTERLDELHLRKIDLADEVFVLNVGGYIGESTSKEIEYAQKHNKPISYLEILKKYHKPFSDSHATGRNYDIDSDFDGCGHGL